jgi:hypothetical protein
MEYTRTFIPIRLEEYAMVDEDFTNPNYIVPILEGEQLHHGYTPVSEEEAFAEPMSPCLPIFSNHFRISRLSVHPHWSLDTLISCIRKLLLYPENNIVLYTEPSNDYIPTSVLYRVTFTIAHAEVDELNQVIVNTNCIVCLHADLENNSYLIEANRYSGDRTAFSRFYKTLRYYIETGGTTNPNVTSRLIDTQ